MTVVTEKSSPWEIVATALAEKRGCGGSVDGLCSLAYAEGTVSGIAQLDGAEWHRFVLQRQGGGWNAEFGEAIAQPDDAVPFEFRAAKKCKKGWSCKGTCISRDDACLSKTDEKNSRNLSWLSNAVSKLKGLFKGKPLNVATAAPTEFTPRKIKKTSDEDVLAILKRLEEEGDDFTQGLSKRAYDALEKRIIKRRNDESKRRSRIQLSAEQREKDKRRAAIKPKYVEDDQIKRIRIDLEEEPPQRRELEIDGHRLEISYNYAPGAVGGGDALDVSFKVDGFFGIDGRIDDATKAKLGVAVWRDFRNTVRGLPNGTMMVTEAFSGDAAANRRLGMYKKMGFGDPPGRNGTVGIMSGFVQDGKLIPTTEEQIDRVSDVWITATDERREREAQEA